MLVFNKVLLRDYLLELFSGFSSSLSCWNPWCQLLNMNKVSFLNILFWFTDIHLLFDQTTKIKKIVWKFFLCAFIFHYNVFFFVLRFMYKLFSWRNDGFRYLNENWSLLLYFGHFHNFLWFFYFDNFHDLINFWLRYNFWFNLRLRSTANHLLGTFLILTLTASSRALPFNFDFSFFLLTTRAFLIDNF